MGNIARGRTLPASGEQIDILPEHKGNNCIMHDVTEELKICKYGRI